MSTPNKPAPAPNTALADRLNQLTQSIAKHETAISRSTRTTGTVGLIALMLMAGYFYYGYVKIAELLQPELLVPLGASMLERNLPAARQALVKQISDSAPAWAETVSSNAQKAIPDLRDKLETYILAETDTLLVQAATLTEDKFRKALHENHELIEKGFQELANDEKLSDASLQALVTALEQQLQADLQDQSATVLETLRFLSARVKRVSAGQGLDQEERCERRIAMLARRLQLMEADPRPITMPKLKSLEPETKPTDSDKPATKDDPKEDAKASAKEDTDKPDSKADDKKADDQAK